MPSNHLWGTPRKSEALKARSYHVNQVDSIKLPWSPSLASVAPGTKPVVKTPHTRRLLVKDLQPTVSAQKKRQRLHDENLLLREQPPSIKRQRSMAKYASKDSYEPGLDDASKLVEPHPGRANDEDGQSAKINPSNRQMGIPRKDDKAEWKSRYLQAMPRFVFHFSGVDNETSSKLSKHLYNLGSRVEAFFDRTVTHVITTQMAIDLLEVSARSGKDATDQMKTSGGDKVLDREASGNVVTADTLLGGSKAPATKSTRPKKLLPAIGPFADAPSFQTDTSVLQLALDFKMKVWSVNKLALMVKALAPDVTQIARARSHGDLQAMLQDERINGTRERDPDAPRNDMHYFAGFYMLVEDATGAHRPIAMKEFKTPTNEFDYPWPVLHQVEAGRVPFGYLPPASVENLRRKVMISNAKKERENDQSTSQPKGALLPAWNPSIKNRLTNPSLRRSASLANLQGHGAALAPPAFGKQNYEQPNGADHDKDEVPASVASGFISSNAPNNPPTTTSALPLHSNGGPRQGDARLELLNRRVLGNLPTQTTLARPTSAPQSKAVVNGKNVKTSNEKSEPETKPSFTEEDQAQMFRLFQKHEKDFPEEAGKAGYCENCKGKFENFNTHLLGRRHRKFAEDEVAWEDIDDFMIKSDRKHKCCEIWASMVECVQILCPDCLKEYQDLCLKHSNGPSNGDIPQNYCLSLIDDNQQMCCCLDAENSAALQRARTVEKTVLDFAHSSICPYHQWQKTLARVLRLHRARDTEKWRQWCFDACLCRQKTQYNKSLKARGGPAEADRADSQFYRATQDLHDFNCPVSLYWCESRISPKYKLCPFGQEPQYRPWADQRFLLKQTRLWISHCLGPGTTTLPDQLPDFIQLYSGLPSPYATKSTTIEDKIKEVVLAYGSASEVTTYLDLTMAMDTNGQPVENRTNTNSSNEIKACAKGLPASSKVHAEKDMEADAERDSDPRSGPSTPQPRRTLGESEQSGQYGTCPAASTSCSTTTDEEHDGSQDTSGEHDQDDALDHVEEDDEVVGSLRQSQDDSSCQSIRSSDELTQSTSLGTADSTPDDEAMLTEEGEVREEDGEGYGYDDDYDDPDDYGPRSCDCHGCGGNGEGMADAFGVDSEEDELSTEMM